VSTLALASVLGCAAARVQNPTTDRSVAMPRPGRVVVFDLYTGSADVRVGRSPVNTAANAVGLWVDEPDVLADAVADTLASNVVDALRAQGLPAERAAKTAPPELNDVVIQGQFVQIDEGSKLRRFVIGFGVGATELRTQIQVFQVTAEGWRPIQQFDTVATGSRFPGAAFFVAGGAAAGTVATSAIISSGVGVVRELRASIDADAGRTAEQISGKISELAKTNRW
jgi:hypothetical protein